jgi:hypothetical protein
VWRKGVETVLLNITRFVPLAATLTLALPAMLEVPQLIGAAHKFLDALDRFWKGEQTS